MINSIKTMSTNPIIYTSLDRPLAAAPSEEQSESAWAEFQHLAAQPAAAPRQIRIKPLRVTLQALIQYCALHGRVCPNQLEWSSLFSSMEEIIGKEADSPPPPPVSQLSWSTVSQRTKRMCFHAHIEWFYKNNRLDEAADFLVNLSESQWMHMEA